MKLLSIIQHPTNGHVVATIEYFGAPTDFVIVTSTFEPAEIAELVNCDNVTNIDFTENQNLNFYYKETPDSPSKYIEFERQYF